MKQTTTRNYYTANRPAYPNAATRREVFQKLLDGAVVAVSGAGIGAVVLLLLALF